MGRPRNQIPTYSEHKGSGQARVRVNGKDVYLGKYGTAESKAAYRRVCAELEVAPAAPPAAQSATGLEVWQVVDRYLAWAKQHYRDEDGNPTGEMEWLKASLPALLDLYGPTPAREFGPLALKAVRQQWVKAGHARTSVNARTKRVRRVFKWAAAEELVPVAVHQALAAVAGLLRGRGEVAEKDPVGPVPDAHVEAVAAAALPTLAALVRTMRLTGMRPGEARRMRAADVDRSRPLWVYAPGKHKTRHRGKLRAVPIGPKAQAVLGPLLDRLGPGDVVFSPAALRAERDAATAARRKAKGTRLQKRRPGVRPLGPPKPVFTDRGLIQAVGVLCKKVGVPHWHPNQLRHTFATEVRAKYGVEAAQVLLGHARADVTQVYAERDTGLAAKVAAEIG